jgi:hypothetical protein
MESAGRLIVAFCFCCGVAAAGSWPGYLVDSKCFAAQERNKSPTDTMTDVDRDRGLEIRYCHPTPKTKSFAFIQLNGLIFHLDAAGNSDAARLVRGSGRNAANLVTVSGAKSGYEIQVTSVSLPR